MEISIANEQARVPVTVFSIKGEIASESYEQLTRRAETEYSGGARHLLLDLNQVGYVSSNGLRALHQIFMMLEVNGSDDASSTVKAGLLKGTYKSPHLKLVNANPDVRRVLEMTGYDLFLEIHTDRQAAIASF